MLSACRQLLIKYWYRPVKQQEMRSCTTDYRNTPQSISSGTLTDFSFAVLALYCSTFDLKWKRNRGVHLLTFHIQPPTSDSEMFPVNKNIPSDVNSECFRGFLCWIRGPHTHSMEKRTEPPKHYICRSCSAIETHDMKVPAFLLYVIYVNGS